MLALSVFASGAQTSHSKHRKHSKPPAPTPEQVVPAPPPQPPPPPPTPEQGPSSPPEVSFQGGQLTITARNSTMSDVLNAVKRKTGAAVDMPVSASERVVGRFGPGAPRDVMAQLLNGSHYDYVLLGSPADPRALEKVVLIARVSGPEPAAPQQPTPQAYNQALQAVPEVDTEQSSDDNQPESMELQQAPEQETQPDQAQPGQGNPAVKTPEQLLRELQQQQQMQQQLQQQQQMQNGQPMPPDTRPQ